MYRRRAPLGVEFVVGKDVLLLESVAARDGRLSVRLRVRCCRLKAILAADSSSYTPREASLDLPHTIFLLRSMRGFRKTRMASPTLVQQASKC